MEHPKEKHLVIRADASTQIGAGHLMRCLALAQAWKDAGGRVTFITACQGEGLLQRLREEEFGLYTLACPYPDSRDWEYTQNVLSASPDAWVVLDGYHFDEVYQQQVKNSGHKLLVIDDMAHLKHYHADIVLNQNLPAEQLQYSGEPYTHLLLGTRYVLLRREFLAWRDWQREVPQIARKVLVTLGGGDPENHTLKVIQALKKVEIPGLEVTAVIGASNPHVRALESAAKQSPIPIRLIQNARNMPELMAWADVAVASAGTTLWELLFLGMPSLILILADNQSPVAEQIESQEMGRNLGWAKNVSVELLAEAIILLLNDFNWRAKMSENASQVVDGYGVQKVVSFMQDAGSHRLRLRPATLEDCHLLWEWANGPDVRAASFASDPIPWEEHVRWFTQKLNDPHCFNFIALDDQGIPVGQVRFDASGDEAEISIGIAPNFRGYDYGAETIRMASQHLFKETAITRIYAHIKSSNNASIHAFTKGGYEAAGNIVVKGHKALQMVLNKSEEASGCDPH